MSKLYEVTVVLSVIADDEADARYIVGEEIDYLLGADGCSIIGCGIMDQVEERCTWDE